MSGDGLDYPHSPQAVPQLPGEYIRLVVQPVRLARQRSREIAKVTTDRFVSVRAAPLRGAHHVRLDVVNADFATLGLQETEITCDLTYGRPVRSLDVMCDLGTVDPAQERS